MSSYRVQTHDVFILCCEWSANTLVGKSKPQQSYIILRLGTKQSIIFALWPHSVKLHLRKTCLLFAFAILRLSMYVWLAYAVGILYSIGMCIWKFDLAFNLNTLNNNFCNLPHALDTVRLGLGIALPYRGTGEIHLAYGGVGRQTMSASVVLAVAS